MQRIHVTIRALNREDSVLYFPPEAFGPFRVLHQIGAGTLGPVFRAYEPGRDRLVAVKVFRLDLTPEQAAALVTELDALVAANIDHPNIAAPIAAGLEHGAVYLAQEYAIGDSLDAVLRERGTMPVGDVVALVQSLGAAIDHAARRGVSHDMLHPRDIIVGPDAARMTGFGIAAALSKVGAKLPTRALNAVSDIDALRAITGAIGATGATGAMGAKTAPAAPVAHRAPAAPIAPIAPIAPDTDFDLRIDEPVDLMGGAEDDPADRLVIEPPPPVFPPAWSAQPPRALHAANDELEPTSSRWPIVAVFLVFAVLTALSVGFFLKSPTPAPVAEKEPAVDATIVDLPASAPTSPNATGASPNPLHPLHPLHPSHPVLLAPRRARFGVRKRAACSFVRRPPTLMWW